MIPPQRDYATRQLRSMDQRLTTIKDTLAQKNKRIKQLEAAITKFLEACSCEEDGYCWSSKSEQAAEDLFKLVQKDTDIRRIDHES